MSLNVHIERLVVEGVSLEVGQGPRLGEAVRVELARLLAPGAWAPAAAGGVTPRLAGTEVSVPASPRPERLGCQIAEAIYRAGHRGKDPIAP
jgi:hypothetical protein